MKKTAYFTQNIPSSCDFEYLYETLKLQNSDFQLKFVSILWKRKEKNETVFDIDSSLIESLFPTRYFVKVHLGETEIKLKIWESKKDGFILLDADLEENGSFRNIFFTDTQVQFDSILYDIILNIGGFYALRELSEVVNTHTVTIFNYLLIRSCIINTIMDCGVNFEDSFDLSSYNINLIKDDDFEEDLPRISQFDNYILLNSSLTEEELQKITL